MALGTDRHAAALEEVRRWTAGGEGRWVVSLFGAPRGLAVFALGPDGTVHGRWDPNVRYDRFSAEVYEVWERALARAFRSRNADDWQVANLLTELLLERVGEWLWRGCPELADGGRDLVVIPHRLFRNIPLGHSMLPGGKRLGELFNRVYHAPSLADLADGLRASAPPVGRASVVALADPDGSLPFARLEAVLAAGRSAARIGEEFTAEALRVGLASARHVLVGCHGEFDPRDPWRSCLRLPGANFQLYEVLLSKSPAAELVVLGVCEAGRSRRSASDEPVGFPGLLTGAGVGAVVAPMWPVDDFASMVFLNRLHEDLARQHDPAEAAQATAAWLRGLDARSTLDLLDALSIRLRALETRPVRQALQTVEPRLERIRKWLQGLAPRERPFEAPLDWAAFQVAGAPR